MLKVIAQHIKQKGFTLVELMVAVAIVGVLAAMAYPSYTQYIQRGNRSAAQSQMMDLANRQQQFLLANRSYADKTLLTASGYSLPSDLQDKYDYTITLGTGPVPSYSITFTAKGNQLNDGNLTYDSDGTKTPADKW